MGKVINKQLALSLAVDCKVMRLKNNEALLYFEQKNCKISEPTYIDLKKEIDENPSLTGWIQDQANTGFVIALRDMLKEMQVVSDEVMRMFMLETSKDDYVLIDNTKPFGPENIKINKDKNRYLILKLSGELRELNARKQALQYGSPIIANIKMEMEALKAKASKNPKEEKTTLSLGISDRFKN